MWLRIAHLLPRALVYWATLRLIVEVTQKNPTWPVPEIYAMDALKEWGDP